MPGCDEYELWPLYIEKVKIWSGVTDAWQLTDRLWKIELLSSLKLGVGVELLYLNIRYEHAYTAYNKKKFKEKSMGLKKKSLLLWESVRVKLPLFNDSWRGSELTVNPQLEKDHKRKDNTNTNTKLEEHKWKHRTWGVHHENLNTTLNFERKLIVWGKLKGNARF